MYRSPMIPWWETVTWAVVDFIPKEHENNDNDEPGTSIVQNYEIRKSPSSCTFNRANYTYQDQPHFLESNHDHMAIRGNSMDHTIYLPSLLGHVQLVLILILT